MPYHFDYISKRNPIIRNAYEEILDIIHKSQKDLRGEITFQYYPVGSYSRNMITWDKKSNVGFDFDFNLDIYQGYEDFTAKEIRDKIRNTLSKHGKAYGYSPAEDSTRVLTLKLVDKKNSKVLRGCDFAIVYNYYDEDDCKNQKYIHYDKERNKYRWLMQTDGFYMLEEKLEWLKDNGHWDILLDYYLDRKNYNPDPSKFHSRDILVQVTHQLCQKFGYYA